MASYNRVVLVGNLARDVELRYIPSGTAVTDIALAVNERVKRNDQWVEEVNFFDVTLWGRTAEIAGEYLSKGSSVLIEGRLKQDKWEKEGQKHYRLKIIGEKMQMLGSKSGGGTGGGRPPSGHEGSDSEIGGRGNEVAAGTVNQGPPPDDDVPF
jgi:single-strand DNA-binding protein